MSVLSNGRHENKDKLVVVIVGMTGLATETAAARENKASPRETVVYPYWLLVGPKSVLKEAVQSVQTASTAKGKGGKA